MLVFMLIFWYAVMSNYFVHFHLFTQVQNAFYSLKVVGKTICFLYLPVEKLNQQECSVSMYIHFIYES